MGRSISLWTMAVREGPGILARGSSSKASWQDFPACKYSLKLEISSSRNNLESTFYMAQGARSCWSCWSCCATSFPAALLQLCCMSSSVTTCSPLWGKLLINLSIMLFLCCLSLSFFAQIVSLDLIHVETKTAQQIYELVSEEMRK